MKHKDKEIPMTGHVYWNELEEEWNAQAYDFEQDPIGGPEAFETVEEAVQALKDWRGHMAIYVFDKDDKFVDDILPRSA